MASKVIDVPDAIPGALISAARAAVAMGFREIAAESDISGTWLQRIERLPSIALRTDTGPGARGIDPEPMARLLTLFRKRGIELRAAGGGHPATLAIVDPVAVMLSRDEAGKLARRAEP